MLIEATQRLCDDHRNIERILVLIRLQVDHMDDEDQDALKLLMNAIGYMQAYPGPVHHRQEDAIIGRLSASDPDIACTFERLKHQHRRFEEQEAELLQLLSRAQEGDAQACGKMREVARLYCKEHADHIDLEERILCPYALKALRNSDWRKIAAEFSGMGDPLFVPNMMNRYGNLYDCLMAMPPPRTH